MLVYISVPGLSEEEVNELEKQEIEAEEEDEKNKRRNILDDLEDRFEKVKYCFVFIKYLLILALKGYFMEV